METREIFAAMSNGSIDHMNRVDKAGEMEWNEHPKFKGVYLKHLIKGSDTGGKLSSHMVKVDPGAVLEEHIHEGEWELHEVIQGSGNSELGPKEMDYYPGRMAVIPKGVKHRVVAGEGGLVILAKFFPALL